jgi:hypothetical protein
MLNPDQVTFLRGAFFSNPTPSLDFCESLSHELTVKPEQVSRWFSNERSKKKRREDQARAQASEMIDMDDLQSVVMSHNHKKKARKSSISPSKQQDHHQHQVDQALVDEQLTNQHMVDHQQVDVVNDHMVSHHHHHDMEEHHDVNQNALHLLIPLTDPQASEFVSLHDHGM